VVPDLPREADINIRMIKKFPPVLELKGS